MMNHYKLNQARIKITDIFDKNEISVWSLGVILRDIAGLFKEMDRSTWTHISKDAQESLEGAVTDILASKKALSEAVTEFINDLDDYDNALYEQYNRVLTSNRAIQKKFNELPKINLPSTYELEKFIEILSRIEQIPSETWARFECLAGALSDVK